VDLPHFESLERRDDNPADHVSDGHPRRVRRAVAVAIVSIAALLIASSAVVFGNSASRPPPPTRTPRVSAPVDVTGVTVPNILGLPIETAMDRLAKAHLQVSTFVYVRGAKGTVVRTDPTPGEAVRAGTSVTIFVGRGSSTAG
jgi:hypothetical protein